MWEKNKFMEMALKIAFDNMGNTSPNPSVGAVIVKNGNIISTGATLPLGSDHAEIVALKGAAGSETGYGKKLNDAEMFVTLEPCSHYGRTPPCIDAMIDSGIRRVYIPILDPNPAVTSRGVKGLRKAGIDVVMMNEFADKAADLIRPFAKLINKNRPFIINKSAVTLDGRIATKRGDSKWISSDCSRYLTHKLRAKVDAVIIGRNTFVKDNPSLNVRIDSFDRSVKEYFINDRIRFLGRKNFFLESLINAELKDFRDPLRIVIGIPDEIDFDYNLFSDRNYILFAEEKQFSRLKKDDRDKLNVIILKGETPREEIDFVLNELKKRNIMLALLEGGGGISGRFLDAGEIDQFLYFISPRVLGEGIPPLKAAGCDMVSQSLKLHDISAAMIGDDLLYCAYSRSYEIEDASYL